MAHLTPVQPLAAGHNRARLENETVFSMEAFHMMQNVRYDLRLTPDEDAERSYFDIKK